MKSAYVIGNITILDPDKWLEYCSKVPVTLIPWEGNLVFRGKQDKVLGGQYQHSDAVVIQFPSIEALNGWFNSGEYQALISLRKQAAKIDLVSYQS